MILRALTLLVFGLLWLFPWPAQGEGQANQLDASTRLRQQGLTQLHGRELMSALASFQAYEDSCACAEASFLKGRVLLELERPQSAASAFTRALQREPDFPGACLHLARAWERLGWAGRADSLLALLPAAGAAGDRHGAASQGTSKVRHPQTSAPDSTARPVLLGSRVNSPSDDYLPWQRVDGQQLYFTSNRPGGLDSQGRAGLHREDLWQSRRGADGQWESARLLEQLNTVASEGGITLSADGRILVFGACDRPGSAGGCDLLISHWTGESWTPAQGLDLVNSTWWDSQPALSADGRELIFASNRPGGLGGRDLWLSRVDSLGQFGTPVNLGHPVNSAGEEAGPYLHADGRSLYFSSDGHQGLGGLDIFLSRRQGLSAWSPPVNLGAPFSTPNPDLGLCLDGTGTRALFASRRDNRDLDLFEAQMPTCCPAEERRLVVGRVVDKHSRQPLRARVRLEPLHGTAPEWFSQEADPQGRFTLVAPFGDALLFADHPGHLYACRVVKAGPQDSLLVELGPLQAGAGMILESIHFLFNEARLPDHAAQALEPLRRLLEAHPELKVELRGHTDDVGGTAHNQELSLKRAQAVKAWLVGHEIQNDQILCSGAGDTEPLRLGRDEAARAANRRTELWLRQP